MPRGDKTGPQGMGPLTGKRLGNCSVSDNSGLGRGRGSGYGKGINFSGDRNYRSEGRFRRRMRILDYNENNHVQDRENIENEIDILKEQLSFLEDKLKKTRNN